MFVKKNKETRTRTMKKIVLLSAVASTIIMAGGDITPMEHTEEKQLPKMEQPYTFFNNVAAKGEIRTRYASVNTDNTVGDANALTNRLMLGVSADLFRIDGLSAYFEAMNVIGSGDYWDLSNSDIGDQGIFNVVADPNQTRITQAYVDYTFGKTLLRAGRQGVNLDNQRFVGTVNWRQMPQTYDAVSLIDNSIENLSLLASYIWQVNTIFDSDTVKPVGDSFDTSSVLLHANYKVLDALSVTGYAYMLEDIHDTYGIAATGKFGLGQNMGLSYRAEYAIQSDPSFENTTTNKTADAEYYNIEATLNMSGFLLGAKYEVLGAGNDGNAAFSTPLSTLHAHNGWADIFLGTPADGLVDLNAMIGYKSKGFGVAKIIYHDFSSDTGSINYGTEIDAIYKNNISAVKGLSAMLKAAYYSADTYSVDTTKYWVMVDYKF